MKIRLNQNEVEIPESLTLQGLLEEFGYQAGNFAVAVNDKFIPNSNYQNNILNSGDEVVIINPMQGG